MPIYAYCPIIASTILYTNIVSTIKKVKNNENTDVNTVIGVIKNGVKRF